VRLVTPTRALRCGCPASRGEATRTPGLDEQQEPLRPPPAAPPLRDEVPRYRLPRAASHSGRRIDITMSDSNLPFLRRASRSTPSRTNPAARYARWARWFQVNVSSHTRCETNRVLALDDQKMLLVDTRDRLSVSLARKPMDEPGRFRLSLRIDHEVEIRLGGLPDSDLHAIADLRMATLPLCSHAVGGWPPTISSSAWVANSHERTSAISR
jgi:hypothetical protein